MPWPRLGRAVHGVGRLRGVGHRLAERDQRRRHRQLHPRKALPQVLDARLQVHLTCNDTPGKR